MGRDSTASEVYSNIARLLNTVQVLSYILNLYSKIKIGLQKRLLLLCIHSGSQRIAMRFLPST